MKGAAVFSSAVAEPPRAAGRRRVAHAEADADEVAALIAAVRDALPASFATHRRPGVEAPEPEPDRFRQPSHSPMLAAPSVEPFASQYDGGFGSDDNDINLQRSLDAADAAVRGAAEAVLEIDASAPSRLVASSAATRPVARFAEGGGGDEAAAAEELP